MDTLETAVWLTGVTEGHKIRGICLQQDVNKIKVIILDFSDG